MAARRPFIAEISGSTCCSNPLSSSRRKLCSRVPGQHAGQFVAHPLTRHHLDLRSQFLYCSKRRRLSISYPKRAANRTARSMRNLSSANLCSGSPIVRIIPAAKIGPSAHEVKHFAASRIEHHAVDGEVAPRYVFPRIPAESHFVRMTPIGIANVAAEGRNFYGESLGKTLPGRAIFTIAPSLPAQAQRRIALRPRRFQERFS